MSKKAKDPDEGSVYQSGYTLPKLPRNAKNELPIHPARLYRTREGQIVRIVEIDTRKGVYPVTVERITDQKDQFQRSQHVHMTVTMTGKFIDKETTQSDQDLFECQPDLWVRKFQSMRKCDPIF